MQKILTPLDLPEVKCWYFQQLKLGMMNAESVRIVRYGTSRGRRKLRVTNKSPHIEKSS